MSGGLSFPPSELLGAQGALPTRPKYWKLGLKPLGDPGSISLLRPWGNGKSRPRFLPFLNTHRTQTTGVFRPLPSLDRSLGYETRKGHLPEAVAVRVAQTRTQTLIPEGTQAAAPLGCAGSHRAQDAHRSCSSTWRCATRGGAWAKCTRTRRGCVSPLSLRRWDVTVLMKGPWTSVTAEQRPPSTAYLTFPGVFLLEREIMRAPLGPERTADTNTAGIWNTAEFVSH